MSRGTILVHQKKKNQLRSLELGLEDWLQGPFLCFMETSQQFTKEQTGSSLSWLQCLPSKHSRASPCASPWAKCWACERTRVGHCPQRGRKAWHPIAVIQHHASEAMGSRHAGRVNSAGDVSNCNLQSGSDLEERNSWQRAQQSQGRKAGKDMGCSTDGQLSEVAWAGVEITDACRVRPIFSMQEANAW